MKTSLESLKALPEIDPIAPSPSPKTTLHFEKSDEDSYIFRRVAGKDCYSGICRAQTKEEVYKLLIVARPNQIVINCATSQREGFQLLEDLREIRHLDDLPIVVISDSLDEATIRLAFALGATRYFLRPVFQEEYSKCISAILSETRVLDQSIADFEQFRPTENNVIPTPSRHQKSRHRYSLLTEMQALKRYPWVYHSV